jgi:uncharacterized protein (TIGR03437 family)
VQWTCDPCSKAFPWMTFDPSSGTMTGTPTKVAQFSLLIQASSQSGDATAQLVLTITNPPACVPTMAPASIPNGEINILYPEQFFSVTGCPGPFTFMVDADPFNPFPLPDGLNFNSTAETLSGTPGQTGTSTFSITATNNQNSAVTTTNSYTIVVNPPPTITTASPLPSGPVGGLYSQQIAATGGIPGPNGYIFSMNNNPPGISISPSGLLNGTPTQAGPFSFNIGVRDSVNGQSTSPFQVTFTTGVPQLQVAPQTLTFNADFQGAPLATQGISVTPASGATAPFSFTVAIDNGQSGTAAPAWISVNPTRGTAPAGLVVSVNQSNLAAGSYPARIRVLDSNNLPTDVAVTLNVNSNPQKLTVAPTMLRFGARLAAPGVLMQDLMVTSTGTGTVAFNATVTNGSSWISSITPNSSQTTLTSPVPLQIQVNTNGLGVGNYHDNIHIASAAGNVDIPISLFVATSGPVLSITPSGFFFHARQNAGSSATDTLEILDIGDTTSTVHWTGSLLTGSNWLNLVNTSGTATPTSPGVLTLALVQNASQMAPGPYYALIQISDSNSLNSPQYAIAVFNVNPDSVAPTPDATPGGLFFTTPVGVPTSAAGQIVVNSSSATPIPFQVAVTTSTGGTWLNATPSSGTVSGQAPGNVSVSVNSTGLAAGIYTGNVGISVAQSLESVNVTFVVQPTASTGAIAQAKPKVTGCTASKLAMTEVGLVNNFAVPAGWPATLIVQLDDDCASPVTNGSVTASFSNGDSPLALVGDSLGNYTATWQPGNVTTDMVVTLNGTSGNLQPATAKLYGGIATNQTPPPTLAAGGTLNNLNPIVGGALAPGMIAEAFGTGLAASSTNTGVLPLPTNFNNTFAQVGPFKAPFYFLSGGQVNIQLPAELTAPQQVPIVLSVNNALTLPVTLDVVPGAPGVLSQFDGPTQSSSQNGAHITAQHLNGTAVNSKSPGVPGEYLVMYLVGLGATDPAVPSGMAASASPLSKVINQPTVTVDSLPSNVLFAGLTPGFVGLYQIDFQVPMGVTSGEVTVTVSQNGVAANPTLLAVSQ